jgi:hypothetical protein
MQNLKQAKFKTGQNLQILKLLNLAMYRQDIPQILAMFH